MTLAMVRAAIRYLARLVRSRRTRVVRVTLDDRMKAISSAARSLELNITIAPWGRDEWVGSLVAGVAYYGPFEAVVEGLERGLANLSAGRVADRDGPAHLVYRGKRVCAGHQDCSPPTGAT